MPCATGHAYSRSRIKNTLLFDTIRDKVKKARKQLEKQARKKSSSDDKISLLTRQLGASKVKPSRSRGRPKSLVSQGGPLAQLQVVSLDLLVLPDNSKETLPRVFYAAAKPTGGEFTMWMRVGDLPWLVNYLHAECGDSSADEESSSGSSSSYGSPHYDAAAGVVRIKVKMADGVVKSKRQRVEAPSEQYVANNNEIKIDMLSWARKKMKEQNAQNKALPLHDAKTESEADAASEASDSANSETSAVSSDAI